MEERIEHKKFELVSKYKPTGDQPQAIEKLVQGIEDGLKTQVLLGVTGSGKTFTMANVINQVQRPTLVIAHNKTLAAQLCNEFRELFPNNSVNYFVSYYDYYQPEAYIVSSDTYIEKELSINDEIDKLRHSATCSLFERDDVIIVASVSCIYGLGEPKEYASQAISLRKGNKMDREELIRRLIDIQYKRNEIDFARGCFRSRGDVVEIFPANSSESTIRVEFFGDEIENIFEVEYVTGKKLCSLEHSAIFPATHYAVNNESKEKNLSQIQKDMEEQVRFFESKGKLIEAQRIKERVSYDIEMIREMGYTNGIENYSRYFDGRKAGDPPYTLFDYLPDNYLLLIDESHITIPQIRAMYNGDRARKDALVNYGFRLPSAYDNRPLKFEEFENRISQLICVSATPGPYEMHEQSQVVEQIIRPTGLLDPIVEVRPTKNQIEDLTAELSKVIGGGGRVLITTLTKRMAEKFSAYLEERGFKVTYLHSEITTLERMDIINNLRAGKTDIIVGINLLREGLDLPEVKLVVIMDADKEGFLRSEGSLIQTIGRTARNAEGRVIMYADVMTDSMKKAIDETNRRRLIQQEYNKEHNIVPKTIIKDIKDTVLISKKVSSKTVDRKSIPAIIKKLSVELNKAVKVLDFEKAIELRDRIKELEKIME
ncbi:MAG: excinuclease ABC subunit UvrB [Christensenellales bacterium]